MKKSEKTARKVLIITLLLVVGLVLSGFLFIEYVFRDEKYCHRNAWKYLENGETLEQSFTPTEKERQFVGGSDPTYRISGFTRGLIRCSEKATIIDVIFNK